MNRQNFLKALFAILFIQLFSVADALDFNKQDTLRLFLIGNSFSQNATRYLPQLAEEGKHTLIIGRAEIGGCSLQKHWELAELAEKDPSNPKGKPYNGKSLQMMLSEGKWDIVTIQQNSMNSSDLNTYQPYAQKLYHLIKALQPRAQVVLHQTWAYRADSKGFSRVSENQFAKTSGEMWQKSRSAYHSIASELGIRIIPVGDAFQKLALNKRWGYRKDSKVKPDDLVYPNLPEQVNSLHRGYYWDVNKKLVFDSNHANESGCFLGALVWYRFLFGESPKRLKYVPEEVPENLAIRLKKVANSVVNNLE